MSGQPQPRRVRGRVAGRERVSVSMHRMTLDLDEAVRFLPGQFCMLNFEGAREMVLSRPFSILRVDGRRLDLLFKVVGAGTRLMADCRPGDAAVCLAPLGRPFPPPAGDLPHLLLAGGVGLPPLWAWRRRWGRDADLNLFGGRDGADVPWDLLDDGWACSVDRPVDVPPGREAHAGTVVDLAGMLLDGETRPRRVLACGPAPLLRAAAELARGRGWDCFVSVEERMGCGYGVCRGCVVPRADGGGYLTACQDGPVFASTQVDLAPGGEGDA